MSKEYQEPEEKELDTVNAEVVEDDFNPLDEAVSEKEYTKHNVRVDPKEFQNDIPEPSFTPPPMTGGLTQEEKVKKPEKPFNKELNELPKKDKEMAAEKVADMFIAGYKFAKQLADNSLLFNEKKIAKLHQEGELDLDLPINIPGVGEMTQGEFISEYNQQTKGTLTVTPEFEAEVKPVLTRVLVKRGIGLTDEQELAFIVGKDVLVSGFMTVQSLSVKKDMLNLMKENTALLRASVNQSRPQPQPVYTPQPQPQYEPDPEPEQRVYRKPHNPDTNVNDFVNEMTGGLTPEEMYYEEPEETPVVKAIGNGTKGKRGRPKKK